MRSPFHKASGPRIRALTGAPSRAKAQAPATPSAAPAAGTVFREFVATLERLEKSRRRRKAPSSPAKGS
ncbi:hypothetical protein EZH22_16880 [Xanthobacter dioxanivorans]|uniref:Uncharacterized protein n=1 Tax=Xanthobacter dioxanivorans TaxID=2528964 RepID=A0A974SGL5_9HYPH|nr:hypothetical protein [Xanthobacter dioxanivorans]QRG04825.1 hypothetical protein EZH22_16880 [Xanthobacter dioxanivorans]